MCRITYSYRHISVASQFENVRQFQRRSRDNEARGRAENLSFKLGFKMMFIAYEPMFIAYEPIARRS